MLEKTLESPLDCKEIQPIHPKGDQPWVFFGRNDVKAETPVLWPLHVKSWLTGKDSDAGRGWGQEEKGTTEDEMAGWHHWLNGLKFAWTPGVGDGQRGLTCCDSWGCKELDITEQLNWTETPHGGGWEARLFIHEPAVFPSPLAENTSHLSISSQFCLHVFHLASVRREGQDFGWQHAFLHRRVFFVFFFYFP